MRRFFGAVVVVVVVAVDGGDDDDDGVGQARGCHGPLQGLRRVAGPVGVSAFSSIFAAFSALFQAVFQHFQHLSSIL